MKKLLLILGIFLLFVVACDANQAGERSLNTATRDPAALKCTDSDGGHEYYVQGFVEARGEQKVDFCSGASTPGGNDVLTEYFCQRDRIMSELYACPDGCVEGACINDTGGIAEGEDFTIGLDMCSQLMRFDGVHIPDGVILIYRYANTMTYYVSIDSQGHGTLSFSGTEYGVQYNSGSGELFVVDPIPECDIVCDIYGEISSGEDRYETFDGQTYIIQSNYISHETQLAHFIVNSESTSNLFLHETYIFTDGSLILPDEFGFNGTNSTVNYCIDVGYAPETNETAIYDILAYTVETTPENPVAGEQVQIKYSVTNLGEDTIPIFFNWICSGGGGGYCEERTVVNLGPGGFRHHYLYRNYTPGQYDLTLFADYTVMVDETNESNNLFVKTLVVDGNETNGTVDLNAYTSRPVPTWPAAGEPYQIKHGFKNGGAVTIPGGTFSNTYCQGVYGAMHCETVLWEEDVPPGVWQYYYAGPYVDDIGQYRASMDLDVNDQIDEPYEMNNDHWEYYNVYTNETNGTFQDLEAYVGVTLIDDQNPINNTYNVTFRIKYRGNTPVTGFSNRWCPDGIYSCEQQWFSGTLNPNDFLYYYRQYTYEPGDYDIQFWTDYNDDILEYNEDNNLFERVISFNHNGTNESNETCDIREIIEEHEVQTVEWGGQQFTIYSFSITAELANFYVDG
ncbi:MAG: CARDB domain-containing protein, partial [Nanoarchaeota archaeon]